MIMKLIRWALGKLILFLDALFSPKAIQREPAEQSQLDSRTRNLKLYQFEACPFCVKVRRSIKRLNLKIDLKDAKKPPIAEELVQGGGELQTPCLRITDETGKSRWLYESDEIIRYLEENFGRRLT